MFLLFFSIILDYLWLFIEIIFVFIIPSTNTLEIKQAKI